MDQLRMLVAIADTGSFTAAAKKVQRAQSAVSHAIGRLEEQLDIQLFDRSTRRPRFTEAGATILKEARSVLVRTERLKSTARSLASGLESDIRIASGVIVPQSALLSALNTFCQDFPTVRITLFCEEIGGPTDLIANSKADIGFSGSLDLAHYDEDVFDKISIGDAGVVSVAHPDHPLVGLNKGLTDADLADHRQLIPTSRLVTPYKNTLVHDVWLVSDLPTRYNMIKASLGWGTVPLAIAQNDLDTGALVELEIDARPRSSMSVPLFAFWRTGDSLGIGRKRFIETLQHHLKISAQMPDHCP